MANDEGLKQSLMRYAIESGAITEKVYRNEMELPIEDMKRFLDGILHIYDERSMGWRTSISTSFVTHSQAICSQMGLPQRMCRSFSDTLMSVPQ